MSRGCGTALSVVGDRGCASKAASQRRWLAKAENRDYFRGREQVARVRTWRAAHPGYGRKNSPRRPALQEHSSAQPVDIDEQSDVLSAPALQDVSLAQSLVLTGLIAHLTGAALQEDIAITSRRLQQLALDIVQGDPDGRETIAVPQPPATHPRAVQLTSAVLDRLLHHAETVTLEDNSFRMKDMIDK